MTKIIIKPVILNINDFHLWLAGRRRNFLEEEDKKEKNMNKITFKFAISLFHVQDIFNNWLEVFGISINIVQLRCYQALDV